MNVMPSQITVLIVYSTICSGPDQRKHQSTASLAFVWVEFTGDRWTQRASNAENVSFWWRHHDQSKISSKSPSGQWVKDTQYDKGTVQL